MNCVLQRTVWNKTKNYLLREEELSEKVVISVEELVVSLLLSRRISMRLSYVHSEASEDCKYFVNSSQSLHLCISEVCGAHNALVPLLPRLWTCETRCLSHCSAPKGFFSVETRIWGEKYEIMNHNSGLPPWWKHGVHPDSGTQKMIFFPLSGFCY